MIVRTWEVTVSLQRTLSIPVEDNEDKDEVIAWLNSAYGKKYILFLVVKNARVGDWSANADLYIDEVELKEGIVTKADCNPLL